MVEMLPDPIAKPYVPVGRWADGAPLWTCGAPLWARFALRSRKEHQTLALCGMEWSGPQIVKSCQRTIYGHNLTSTSWQSVL
jgi:hypothetical protein